MKFSLIYLYMSVCEPEYAIQIPNRMFWVTILLGSGCDKSRMRAWNLHEPATRKGPGSFYARRLVLCFVEANVCKVSLAALSRRLLRAEIDTRM